MTVSLRVSVIKLLPHVFTKCRDVSFQSQVVTEDSASVSYPCAFVTSVLYLLRFLLILASGCLRGVRQKTVLTGNVTSSDLRVYFLFFLTVWTNINIS